MTGTDPDFESMDLSGRIAVVTGATHGIGRPTAAGLAALGATVVLHGRDPAAVDRVAAGIRSETGNPNVSGVVGRFDSLADVHRIADEILAGHSRLDILVNNAGSGPLPYRLTDDGFEWLFGVNHVAPFVLTNRLLGRLEASAPARIVTVASAAHRRAALDLDDLDWQRRRYRARQAYGDSKLANILFTRELAARIAGTGVTANCLHPGVVATNIFAGLGIAGWAFKRLARPWLLTPEAGARTSIHLAAAAGPAAISGEYFDLCAPAPTTAAGRDMALARRLWRISAERAGLDATAGDAHDSAATQTPSE